MSDDRYQLTFQLSSGCLHVQCSGILNAETDQLIDEEIRQACVEHGVRRVLIDIRGMKGRLSMLENFQAGATFGKRLGRVAERIAIVDRMEDDPREGNLFFELVATNRHVFVKFFGNTDAAQSWLSGAQRAVPDDSAAPR